MAKNRYINTQYWRDDYISSLEPEGKLLFLYLITNPDTSICGIYQLPIKIMAADTGIENTDIEKLLQQFERDEKIIFRNGWIAIRNFIKHQKQSENENDKINRGIQLALENCPENLVKWISGIPLEAPSKGRQKKVMGDRRAFDYSNSNINSNINSNSNSKTKDSSELSKNSEPLPVENEIVVLELPLIPKDGTFPITQTMIDEWVEFFPAVDIIQTIKNMIQWTISNPEKRKTLKGARRFITRWLSKEQDRGGNKARAAPAQAIEKKSAPVKVMTDEEVEAMYGRA